MKSINTKRLSLSMAALCFASALAVSVSANANSEKAIRATAITLPAAISSDNKVETLREAIAAWAVNPTPENDERLLMLQRIAEDKARHSQHDANNYLALEAQLSGSRDVRLVKNIMQNSSLYAFNLGVQTVSPKLSHVLNNTVAFYQRQRTNVLLAELVSKQHTVAAKVNIPFSTGKNALLLQTPSGKTIPFFEFIRDFHAHAYVQQCIIPLVRQGNVSLHQLHLVKNIFTFLRFRGDDNATYRLHHCNSRSLQWNKRLYSVKLHAVHEASLLTAANTTSMRHHHIASTAANAVEATALSEAIDTVVLHPTHANLSAYLDLRRSVRDRLHHELPNAVSTQIHYWDPTVTLKINGRSTRINPVERIHFNGEVVYFNGDNVWQVAFARALLKHSSLPVILISTQGNPKSLMQMLHAPVSIAQQHGIEKLHITSVPTVVTVGSGRYANHLVLTTVKLPYHLLNQKVHAFNSDNIKSNDAALAAGKAWKKAKLVSTSAGGGGINIVPGGFNFISAKKFDKFLKDVLSEKVSNVAPTKADDNANHDKTTDLAKFFNSLGYSNNAISPEAYNGGATGYYWASKPVSTMKINVNNIPTPTSSGAFDVLHAPLKKGSKTQ